LKKIQKSFCLVATSDKAFWAPTNNVLLSNLFNNYDIGGKHEGISKVCKAFNDSPSLHSKRKAFILNRMPAYRTIIAKSIKNISGINLNNRQQKILLDLWLFHFLTVVFDRVNAIKFVLDSYDAKLSYMLIEDISPPNNSMEFINRCQSERFNQFAYAEAARIFGVEIISLSNPRNTKKENKFFFKFLSQPLFIKFLSLKSALSNTSLIISSSITKAHVLKIFFKSFGRIWILPNKLLFDNDSKIEENSTSRATLLNISETDYFDKYASVLLKKSLPIDLFERYSYYYESLKGLFTLNIIASDTEHYWNDQYKILAAHVLQKGGRVDAIQHGGNYNIYNFSIHTLEASLFDRFYYWSLSQKYQLPSFRIDNIKNSNFEIQRNIYAKKILFVISIKGGLYPISRYNPNYFQATSSLNFNNLRNFYNNLHEDLRGNYVLRPHPHGVASYRFENWINSEEITTDISKNIMSSLLNSKIIILDALSTTWIEILYLNIPLIIVFDYMNTDVSNESKKIFQALKSAKVLHANIDSASAFINNNYHKLDEWWNNPMTKKNIDFAKNSLIDDKNLVSKVLYNFSS
jgi:putative transferase (TIGR04331 family)